MRRCGYRGGFPGTDGIISWLKAHRSEYKGIVMRSSAGNPGLPIYAELTAEDDSGRRVNPWAPVIDWKSTEVGSAWAGMYDKVKNSADPDKPTTFKHLPHPGLDTAACTAAVRLQPGGAWTVDWLKSPHDVAPLYAAAGALWGLDFIPDDGPSIYAGSHGRDVLVI